MKSIVILASQIIAAVVFILRGNKKPSFLVIYFDSSIVGETILQYIKN